MAKLQAPASAHDALPRTEVDDVTLGKVLHCDEQTIRKYNRMRIVEKVGPNRYVLFPSIGSVVDYLRSLAGGQGNAQAAKSNAALKDAQRRLVDLRYQREAGLLLSLPDAEAAWGEVADKFKWLFLTLPSRVRQAMPHLSGEDIAELERVCAAMLREAATPSRPPDAAPSIAAAPEEETADIE